MARGPARVGPGSRRVGVHPSTAFVPYGSTVRIEIQGLTKRYGQTLAVAGVSFDAPPGRVTGFLGPNGSGKSTTMRCLLGLAAPDSGSALFDGRPYRALRDPLRLVGAMLDPDAYHPARSGRDHLRVIATSAGLPDDRVDRLLDLVELREAARRPAGGYSLGMRQRLHLAAAMLGDPQVLVLDEPTNGLDPGGIRWMRDLLRAEAAEGRTVLLSSHVLSEVEQTVDEVVVIARGRIVTTAG